MHRIDGPGATPAGLFTEGDPGVGAIATDVTADWGNAVQLEMEAVILAAGLTLNKPDNTQLLQAIRAMLTSVAPVGKVEVGYFNTAPAGFLLAHGGLFSRTTFPALYAHAVSNGLIVTDAAWLAGATGMFSSGDGATTFRLPDLRGEHFRMVDAGRGIDATFTLGSKIADQMPAHSHTIPATPNGSGTGGSGPFVEGGLTRASGITGTGTEVRVRAVVLNAAIKY